MPLPVDFNAVPLVYPLVATFRLVCGLTLRCGTLFIISGKICSCMVERMCCPQTKNI